MQTLRPDPLPTIRGHCNTCGRETEQYRIGRDTVCGECLMNPAAVLKWEKEKKKCATG